MPQLFLPPPSWRLYAADAERPQIARPEVPWRTKVTRVLADPQAFRKRETWRVTSQRLQQQNNLPNQAPGLQGDLAQEPQKVENKDMEATNGHTNLSFHELSLKETSKVGFFLVS